MPDEAICSLSSARGTIRMSGGVRSPGMDHDQGTCLAADAVHALGQDRVALRRHERGWWTCDWCTEPGNGRFVGLPRPRGDLPGDEGQLPGGIEDPGFVRPEDPQVGRSAARRPAAAREPAVLAVPAPCGHASVLA